MLQRQLPPLGPKSLIAKQPHVHAQSYCKAQAAAANPIANGPSAFDPQRISMDPNGNCNCFFNFLGICTQHSRSSTSTEDCVARHFAQAFGQHRLVPKREFESSTSHKPRGYLLSGLVHV